jgi:hypothetical protein
MGKVLMLKLFSQVEGLTELTKDWCISSTELSYRGKYFDWLAVWLLNPDWHRKLEIGICW